MKSVNVSIEKLVPTGKGLARLGDGKIVFIPGVLPGETIRAETIPGPGGTFRGRVLSIQKPSPIRVEPPCPLSERCGGCDWLFIQPDWAIKFKEEILMASIQRAGLTAPVPLLHPSPKGLPSRARARMHVDRDLFVLGFKAARTTNVQPIDECPAMRPGLSKSISDFTKALKETPLKQACQVMLALDDDQRLACMLLDAKAKPLIKGYDRLYQSLEKQGFLVPSPKQPILRFDGPLLSQVTGLDCFFQANPEANNEMVTRIIELTKDKGTTALDLFCGAGNISLNLAMAGFKVTGMDSNRKCLGLAEKRARELKVRAGFRLANLFAPASNNPVLSKHYLSKYDLVVMDPPRAGAKVISRMLAQTGPSSILQIGCDPATFARDSAALAAGQYEMVSLDLFDFFPGTHHMEILASWQRR
ncbi:MAG: class I SAM-dependent RNA methyltransferase [Deltaproteobacteria bacterium]|nr:class I SAM-dependent RNA methyltransferase [Deltaproteobacteria bacterium]